MGICLGSFYMCVKCVLSCDHLTFTLTVNNPLLLIQDIFVSSWMHRLQLIVISVLSPPLLLNLPFCGAVGCTVSTKEQC